MILSDSYAVGENKQREASLKDDYSGNSYNQKNDWN